MSANVAQLKSVAELTQAAKAGKKRPQAKVIPSVPEPELVDRCWIRREQIQSLEAEQALDDAVLRGHGAHGGSVYLTGTDGRRILVSDSGRYTPLDALAYADIAQAIGPDVARLAFDVKPEVKISDAAGLIAACQAAGVDLNQFATVAVKATPAKGARETIARACMTPQRDLALAALDGLAYQLKLTYKREKDAG